MSKVIPRFLYHLTTKANYESIMQSGFLKTSRDMAFGEGIYTTELTNFFKRWGSRRDFGEVNLQSKLIRRITEREPEIVILKIPTEGLNIASLRIRNQKELFGKKQPSKGLRELFKTLKSSVASPHEVVNSEPKKNFIDRFSRLPVSPKDNLNKQDIELILKDNNISEHLAHGVPVYERKLFQRRKEAIEYIYREDIPTSQIEKIGEVNVDELRKTAEYDPLKPMRSIFSALLRGTPQEKGALLLNC